MTFDKGGHVWNDKKKDWFSHNTGLDEAPCNNW